MSSIEKLIKAPSQQESSPKTGLNPQHETWKKRIEKLPQSRFILPENMDRFLNFLNENPEEANFHIRRLAGWGGSEIGCLVSHLRGEPDPFTTASLLVQEKLLIRLPEPSNIYMEVGKTLEPLAQRMFTSMSLATSQQETINSLKTARNQPGYEWLRSSPDDVLKSPQNSIWVVDYKIPSKQKTNDDEHEFRYECQVHHYAADIAMRPELNINIDYGGIVYFNLEGKEMFVELMQAGMDMMPILEKIIDKSADTMKKTGQPIKGCSVNFKSFAIKPELIEEIKHAGDHFWNEYVMKGEIPLNLGVTNEEIPGQVINELRVLQDEFLYFDLIAKEAEQRAKQLKMKASELIAPYGRNILKKINHATTVSFRKTVDWAKAAHDLVSRHGMNANELYQDELDTDGLVNAAIDNGIDVDKFKIQGKPMQKRISKLLGTDLKIYEKLTVGLQKSRAKLHKADIEIAQQTVSSILDETQTYLKNEKMISPEIQTEPQQENQESEDSIDESIDNLFKEQITMRN